MKFPVYDDEGRVTGVCGISTDITDIKKTRDQLRLLSDSIIESQERERTAVSRELHDMDGEGLGLAGMRERASLVNGELEIRTRAGHGTSVIFKVDIDIPEKAEQE